MRTFECTDIGRGRSCKLIRQVNKRVQFNIKIKNNNYIT